MIKLVQNELMKIFSKKASWIYMIFLLLACIFGGILFQKIGPAPSDNWREEMTAEIQMLEQELATVPDEEKVWIQGQIDEMQQSLQDDINPNAKSTWHFMNSVVIGIGALVTLFAVIVCSGNVAAEFSDGTIKQLLIRPHKRWAILLSKYIAVTLYSLMLCLVLFISGYLVGLILFGSGDFNAKIYEWGLNGQTEAIVGQQVFIKLLYSLPSLLVTITIAFMLSTLFKSQALAVGVGIFVLFISSTLGGLIIFLAERYTWAKFLIFPHMDLGIYAIQDTILQDVTLPISLAILAVYYVIFITLTFTFFQKRDISI